MASPSLDQLVKGAPASGKPVSSLPTEPDAPNSHPQAGFSMSSQFSSPPRSSTPDPLSTLPSAPPQIYLNLLILESSFRAQYLALRERRRQNTFFLLLLAAWIAYFSYALFLRPREDGRGVGGSVYWVVEMGDKVALLGGVVTALLVWGTGQWERGVRWPRRWLAVSNRGLRNMNTKIVVIRGPWWQELLSYLSFLFPFSTPFFPSPIGDFHFIERPASDKRVGGRQYHQEYHNVDPESGLVEEDLSPGGDYIRLLLLPKSFSPEFRGNWDDYRTEYWEKENERRAQLRQKLRQKERLLAEQDGSWFGYLGFGWKAARRRRLAAATLNRPMEGEKHRHHHHHHPSISRLSHELKSPVRRSTRSDSHSRTPSRSTTPVDLEDRPPSRSSASGRPRRGSTPTSTTSASEQSPQHRRKRGSKTLTRGSSPLTQAQIREGVRTASFSSDDSAMAGLGDEKINIKEEPVEI